jgi:hypothetical protein
VPFADDEDNEIENGFGLLWTPFGLSSGGDEDIVDSGFDHPRTSSP